MNLSYEKQDLANSFAVFNLSDEQIQKAAHEYAEGLFNDAKFTLAPYSLEENVKDNLSVDMCQLIIKKFNFMPNLPKEIVSKSPELGKIGLFWNTVEEKVNSYSKR